MTSSFFSDNNCLERGIDVACKASKLSDIWNPNELNRCIKFIKEGSFSRVCLQFPDETINYSGEIEKQLKRHVDSRIFILADTSYGSCCVDEVREILCKISRTKMSFFINNFRWLLLMFRLTQLFTLDMLASQKLLDYRCSMFSLKMRSTLTSSSRILGQMSLTKWKKFIYFTMLARFMRLVCKTLAIENTNC